MHHLIGEYEVAVDAKGRFLLPSGFRRQLPDGAGDRFVINRGFESCLTMYTMETWNALSEKINKLNDFNPKVREFKRLFLNGANIVEVDSAGRMLLSKPLLDFTGITKENGMVLSAQGNKVELWDKDTYYTYLRERAANFSSLAEEVAGGSSFNPFED